MGISFRIAFLSALAASEKTLEQIAEAAGVPLDTLEALMMSEHASISVEEAIKVAGSFETTLDQFLEDSSVSGHIQIAQLYSALPPLLKAQLEAYARELSDAPDPAPAPKPR